ncbi:hypothetical protein KF728_02095 [Candidatus Obscuribacterales bacterium]|nr:hypothetical protein [Candidatus Obscuribacterales bacterium]
MFNLLWQVLNSMFRKSEPEQTRKPNDSSDINSHMRDLHELAAASGASDFNGSYLKVSYVRDSEDDISHEACSNQTCPTCSKDRDFDFMPTDRSRVRIRVVNNSPLASTISNSQTLKEQNEYIKKLDLILEKQDNDAEMRSNDTLHYGNTGMWVRYAAWDARDAIRNSLDEALQKRSTQPIIDAVAAARLAYADYYDDDDGFGSGTFGEILRDLNNLHFDGEERDGA